MRWRCGAPLVERRPLLEVRANAARGWEMIPGTSHFTYTHPVRVNNLGLRGPDVAPKRPGEARVFALGDSLLYGQGVPDGETIAAHLERELRGGGAARDVTVVNGGLRAYSTNQELGLLRELAGVVRPELALLFWYVNDLGERDIAATYQSLQASGPITFDVGGRLEGAALWKWRAKQILRRSALVMEAHDVWKAFRATPDDPAFAANGFLRLDGYLRELADFAREHGFAAAIVVVPCASGLRRDDPSVEAARRVCELALANGLAVIDPIEDLRAHTALRGRLPVVPYDGHYDGPANAAIARAVALRIAAEGWLGAATSTAPGSPPATGGAGPGGGPGGPSAGPSRSSGSGTPGSR